MRRTLQIALLGIFLVSAIAGGVIGYVSVLRITDNQAAREVSIAHEAISAKFRMFDTLLGREEREMEARMASALPIVAQQLLGLDLNFQRASDAELAALSKKLGVDNIYIIDKKTRIVATDFPADKGFELGTISDGFRSFLTGLIGNGKFVADRINLSSNTGILQKYGYYSPHGSEYIAEVSIDVRKFLAEERSQEFVDFLFSSFFKELVNTNEFMTDIDIHMVNRVAAFSLFDRNQNLTKDIVEQLRHQNQVEISAGRRKLIYSRISPVDTRLTTAEFLVITSKFDFSALAGRIQLAVFYIVGMMIIAAGLAYLIAVRLATRYVIDRVETVRAGVSRIADGDFKFDLLIGGRDEINDIVDDINVMKSRLAMDIERREVESRKLNLAIAAAEEARQVAEEQGIELVRMADEQIALRKDAERAEKAKSEFLASMSHEIRTPMTGVMGFADLLLEDGLNEASRDKVYRIKDSTQVLLRIINDILDVSKLEAGKFELEHLDFHFPSLIQEVVDMFAEKRHGSRANSVELEIDLAEDFPVGVNLDPTRIRQLLINLVGNARKFTEKGTITVVGQWVEKDTAAPMLYLAIKDTGIGIKPDVIDSLFGEFTQADASISRRFHGTGLGLSICKKLVTLMGGEIGVDSTYGKGSTFWFTLPYRAAQSDVEHAGRQNIVASGFVAARPIHILVVDDNALNRQIIGGILRVIGHTFDIAENGMQAVEMHKRGRYDLILMDIRMPVMSGPDATQLIRQMDGDKSAVPIIALTADAMEDHQKAYLAAGMNGVATKPIEIPVLALTMNEVMGDEINIPCAAPEPQAAEEEESDDANEEANLAAVDDFLKQITASSE